ncbi:MAG TPA: Fe-S cluster assembly protein HesB [Candidatus Nanoarchaeia archaeon]|nr:Fe-S cluster assembly protein HesB [Candidatus Nanoarchaeia archaeon]
MAIKRVQNKILGHYAKLGRDFPWRKTKDPYKILVSEVMLQQTQTERVVPKYSAFVERYPNVFALSKANDRELLLLWSGLGYNRRAISLKRACQEIVERFGGEFPKNEADLRSLPGIGPYTSRAVLAFAFNKAVPVVDTNIRRILIHEFGLDERISFMELEKIAKELIPKGKSRIWHNALMDYGAMVATARKTGVSSLGKQGKFEGSRRWYRSQIVKMALKGNLRTQDVSKQLKTPLRFIRELCLELSEEGLIKFRDKEIWV